MTPIGMGLAFAAYTLGLWGYCLCKSYDVPFSALFAPTWPGEQVNVTAPSGGRKLGTINNSTTITNPGGLPVQGT
jgi:hypothetical protein